jgi:hypothetical protein
VGTVWLRLALLASPPLFVIAALLVIPAKAGIQRLRFSFEEPSKELDCGFRQNDEPKKDTSH